MKRYLQIIACIAATLCIITPATLRADDTEIYGTVGVSVEPNVLIIFDTSGSMSTVDVVSEEYNPATTYTGSYPTNAVYRSTYYGWTLVAGDVNTICPGARDLLLVDGFCRYAVTTAGACGGYNRDLRLGNFRNYEASGAGAKDSRINVAKTVVKNLIETTSGVRFGLMRFNNDQGGRIVKGCGSATTSELTTAVDGFTASDWTPLGETLAEAGLYFAGMNSWYNSGVSYTSPMTDRCQKNYIILMTDGEPTQDNDWRLSSGAYINGDTIGDYDNDGNDPGTYASYGTDYLDDVAKYLYVNDCNPSLGTGTSFERQNIITYTIGFKSEQQLLQDTATNGGGAYYTAQNISGLNEAFQQIMSNISEQNAVFVSPVVPVSRMNRAYAGNYIYVGFFKPQQTGRWLGNLKKYGLDSNGDLIDADGTAATLADGRIIDNARSYWSTTADGSNVASGGTGGVLMDQTARYLYTYMGTQSALTNADNAFTAGNSLITNSVVGVASDTERTALINDIYGGSRFWYLGDVLHSEPAVVHYPSETYIFTGSNDGMMHCFVDSTGSELWGFIPPEQLGRLPLLLNNDHDYFVDGSPVVYSGSSQKILFFGERRGGDHYYALDITTPASPSWLYKVSPDILGGGDAQLGQSWIKATQGTIKTSTTTWADVFILGGGYDTNQDLSTPAAGDTLGRAVFAVQVTNGSVNTLNFNKGNFSSMDHSIVDVTGFDTSSDGYINAVYAGDLGGNIFAFEDHNGDGTWSGRKLFSASAVDSVQRKMFYAPDAVIESFGDMIFIGTGNRAAPSNTSVVNRIYAIKNTWEDTSTFTTLDESDLIDVTDNLIQMGTAAQKAQALADLKASKGWYIRLENTGEKVLASPTVYGGVVYFTTYTPDTSGAGPNPLDPCDAAGARGTARLYAVNYLTGGAVHDYSSATETDADGNVVERGKLDRSKVIGTAIPSAPVIAILESGAKMYIGVEGGVAPEDPVSTFNANVFYWRQIF